MSGSRWLAVLLGLAMLVPVAGLAGDTEPPAGPTDPASAMPTLKDLYQRLVSGAFAGYVWAPLGGWTLAPAGALSARVEWVMDAGALAEMVANLDDLLFFEMLFGNGFEWGDETGWSNAVP